MTEPSRSPRSTVTGDEARVEEARRRVARLPEVVAVAGSDVRCESWQLLGYDGHLQDNRGSDMSGENATEVPMSLLYRIDSITSLVYHRERGGLSDESAAELLAVSTAVRKITDAAEGKPR